MKIKIPVRLLIAIAAMFLAAVPLRADKWTMNEFMIGMWSGPGADEAMARAYHDAHFNTVMESIDQLDMIGKYGLKGLVMGATPEIAAANKDNPNVWGWFVRDEPKTNEFEATAVPVAQFHEADPNHPAYVNMISIIELKPYFEIVKPRFLSYDYYQWWWGPWMHFYFLDMHRREALKRDVPLIVWVESNADPRYEFGKPGAGYLPDNAVKLRQSVYTSLAYGVKGIQWFTGTMIFKHGADGKLLPELNETGEDIKKINGEVEALGPILVKLRSTGVYNTAPPVFAEDTPGPRWVKANGINLTVGMFESDGVRYVLIVNRDITKPNTAKLDFKDTVNKLSIFDRQVRSWVEEPAKNTISIELKAGDGELLKVE